MIQFYREIQGVVYPLRLLEAEVYQTLTYNNVIIPALPQMDGFFIIIPGLTVKFETNGQTFVFPISVADFVTEKQGTLKVTLQTTLPTGIYTYPFYAMLKLPPIYGYRGFGKGGFGAESFEISQEALPRIRYFITGWANMQAEILETHYVRGLIT
jgi:hypothetical protein